MNFLAHIFLSGNNLEIMVGNFIGDFVKGAQMDDYPDNIRSGIILHREIDHFTDTHPIVLKSKERLRPEFRHYSPVIVDVFYDHYLAKDWEQFSDITLEEYTHEFYNKIGQFKEVLPDSANHMLTYMKRDNWLYNYRLTEGIHRALSGMARRTPYNSKMEQAAKFLEQDYDAYATEFHNFFPELRRHSEHFLSSNK
jgi:acyl carrier protein phosphodiesterase